MNSSRVLLWAVALALAATALPSLAVAQPRCGEVETTPDEGHLHLLGEADPPLGYRSTPPASGWHYRQRDRVRLGVAPPDAPLTEPEHVSVLAVGGVVVSYRDLAADDLATLEDVVAAAGQRPVALTGYDALAPGEVALSAWRTVQRCDGVDAATVEAFVSEHAAEAPDFTMAGDDHAGHAETGAAPAAAGRGSWPPWVLGTVGLGLLAGFGVVARLTLRSPAAAPRQGR